MKRKVSYRILTVFFLLYAASWLPYRPPSLNESGVRLRTPMMTGRPSSMGVSVTRRRYPDPGVLSSLGRAPARRNQQQLATVVLDRLPGVPHDGNAPDRQGMNASTRAGSGTDTRPVIARLF